MKFQCIFLFLVLFGGVAQAQTYTIDFKEQYYDYEGKLHDFNKENIVEHPFYEVVDRGRYYVINRSGTWVDLQKQMTCNGNEISINYYF